MNTTSDLANAPTEPARPLTQVEKMNRARIAKREARARDAAARAAEDAQIAAERKLAPPTPPVADPEAALRREMTGADIIADGPAAESLADQMARATRQKFEQSDVRTSPDIAATRVVDYDAQMGDAALATRLRRSPSVDLDAPAGTAVDPMTSQQGRVAPVAERVLNADDLDAAMGSNAFRAPQYFDWCRDRTAGRMKFSRHYYRENVLVDRFGNDGAAVQREVALKIAQIERYNDECELDSDRVGYIAYIVGMTPSREQCAAARGGRVFTEILYRAPVATIMPGARLGVVHDMSSPTLGQL